jgi:glycosyltransferase involved in cell wall biosynthesis
MRKPECGMAPVLVLVGDGSERAMLEGLARALGIADRVMFLGWRDEVEKIYGAFDLFTLTSRSEGTSISLLEAMSTGLCPVVTDVGGNRGVLGPDLASLLVPREDDAALAASWQRYLIDVQLRRSMGSRARARVVSQFSLDRMIGSHIEVYRELMKTTGDLGADGRRDQRGECNGTISFPVAKKAWRQPGGSGAGR